jgi:hypothetical protein
MRIFSFDLFISSSNLSFLQNNAERTSHGALAQTTATAAICSSWELNAALFARKAANVLMDSTEPQMESASTSSNAMTHNVKRQMKCTPKHLLDVN